MQSFWRARKIDEVTSDDDKIAPVYRLDEICSDVQSSPSEVVKEVVDYIMQRLNHSSPFVKQKALRLIKYTVSRAGTEFRRSIQRHSATIKGMVHYRGQPDPLRGDAPNKAVREAAQEAVQAIFNPQNDIKPGAGATGVSGGGGSASTGGGYNGYGPSGGMEGGRRRMEGFGSTPARGDGGAGGGGGGRGGGGGGGAGGIGAVLGVSSESIRQGISKLAGAVGQGAGGARGKAGGGEFEEAAGGGSYVGPRLDSVGGGGDAYGYGGSSGYGGSGYRQGSGYGQGGGSSGASKYVGFDRQGRTFDASTNSYTPAAAPAAYSGAGRDREYGSDRGYRAGGAYGGGGGGGGGGGPYGSGGGAYGGGGGGGYGGGGAEEDRAGGGWGDGGQQGEGRTEASAWGGASGSGDGMSGGAGGGAGGGGASSEEERLVEGMTGAGGVRLQPTREALRGFIASLPKLNAGAVAQALEARLLSNLWQTRLKAMCVVEAVVRQEGDPQCDAIYDFFADNPHALHENVDSPQTSLRDKARRVLDLLGLRHQQGGQPSPHTLPAAAAVVVPDLIDVGEGGEVEGGEGGEGGEGRAAEVGAIASGDSSGSQAAGVTGVDDLLGGGSMDPFASLNAASPPPTAPAAVPPSAPATATTAATAVAQDPFAGLSSDLTAQTADLFQGLSVNSETGDAAVSAAGSGAASAAGAAGGAGGGGEEGDLFAGMSVNQQQQPQPHPQPQPLSAGAAKPKQSAQAWAMGGAGMLGTPMTMPVSMMPASAAAAGGGGGMTMGMMGGPGGMVGAVNGGGRVGGDFDFSGDPTLRPAPPTASTKEDSHAFDFVSEHIVAAMSTKKGPPASAMRSS
ncbi:unnamed protein product [Closterium sp. Naga37s-1]|nr:unnamed protein product [Closterium sp. Naga37s-1]